MRVLALPFLLAAIFFSGHPYIGSTTVLPDRVHALRPFSFIFLHMRKTYRLSETRVLYRKRASFDKSGRMKMVRGIEDFF